MALRVIETFTDTIPDLLSEDAYRDDDTAERKDSACVFEVGNEAPQAKVDIRKSKSADIVFTAGDTSNETLNTYNDKAEALKKIMKENGIDARIDAISTSTLTAQDKFAWKEYDHCNYRDYYLPTMDKHILYEENDIRMTGYSRDAMKDFLYVPDNNPGRKTFEFDLQRDRTDWHSMEGGGFLFNTKVDEQKDTIRGFCILVTRQGLKLVWIDCSRLTGFRNGSYNLVQQAGKLLGTFAIDNLYGRHHFKIVTDQKSVSVWDGDKLIADDYVLPENDYGNGFGPIVSHTGHCCRQQSYFTFRNITMQTMTGSSLSDIVGGYDWRAGASHYVVNLSQSEVPELSSDEETAELAAALIENQAAFIGIGNDINENQYHGLLTAVETGGMVMSADEISPSMDTVNKWITDSVLAKDYSIEKYITTDDIAAYEGAYRDAENDGIYEQRWEYEYDPSVFGGTGETEHIIRKEDKPITVFEDTGAYRISLNIRDNPAGDNDALDCYRKWSGTEEYEKLLIVQSRPRAEVRADVIKDEKESTQCIASASYSAEDADHPDDSRKGIRKEYFHYKNVKDADWTEGRIPNRLTIGETYLVKYQVKDVEGTLSFPAAAVIKTSDLRTFDGIKDSNPPEVYIDASRTEISAGEELRIDGGAEDDYGVECFTMSIDGKKVLDCFGRVVYTPDREGTVRVEATATDIGGNTAKKELIITVTDDRDKTAPAADITSPAAGSDLDTEIPIIGTAEDGKTVSSEASCDFYNLRDKNPPSAVIASPVKGSILTEPADIKGSVYDEEKLDSWKLEYQMSGEREWHTLAQGSEAVKDGVLGHFDTTMLMNGKYTVKLTVKDTGGNIQRTEKDYTAEGGLKFGAMHIGFTDISALVGGTTVNLNRMYDSRDKSKGEFGYGWTLGLQGIDIYENEEIYEGYELVKTGSLFSTGYQMTEALDHDVTVCYGDGTSDRFEIAFSPERKALIPISEVKIGYRCVTNPKVKLEILGDTTAYMDGGQLIFIDESMYDPLSYKLTTEEGTEIYLNRKKGVYRIKDGSGNVIMVDKNGYHSRDGKSVTLKRDSENRVVSATDPPGNTTSYTYDGAGDLVSVTDSAGRIVSYAYDKDHNLVSITDPTGVAVARNEYDDEGRLTATIDADGNRIEYDYDVEGRTQSVKDRRGNTTVYSFDDNGNVLQTVDACGNKTTNNYDKSNNLLSATDANGNTTSYTYDKSGNVTSVTAADETVAESTYTQDNHVSSIQMMDKTLLAMKYDDHGRIASVEDASGNDTEYSYTGDGKLIGLIDAIGTYQKVTYDSDGNAVSTTNGAGESASYTYDKDGEVTSVTISRKENGRTINFTSHISYNAAGEITECIDNAGNVTRYEYDDRGNQTACVDAKGRRITCEYDDLGNLTKTAYPDGTFESFTYDANGNNITATDRTGLTVTMKYDKLNRMTQKACADGTKETYVYDAAGNVTERTSASGAKTAYVYDERNRNTSITDALGNVTTFAYDEMSRLTSCTDAKGNRTSYEYDDNGNITRTVYADGSSVSSKYDARNRVTEQKDQNGNVTRYTYDGADRLTGVTDACGNSYTYGYDGNGNLVKVTDAEEHVTRYAFDALGRTAKVINALGKTMEYSYDETGNLTQFKDYAGTVTKYSYDDMDRMVRKTAGEDVTEYSYDNKGLLLAVTDKSGTVRYQYDKYGRLAKKTDTKGITLSYTYDKAGRLETFDNGFGKTAYEYDLLDRVTRVTDRNGMATVYEYDEAGNRGAVRYPNGTVMSYTYDACQRLKEEWVTDAGGVTLAKYSYGLGKAGERLSVTEKDASGETETTFRYDRLNRLVNETIARDGNELTNEYSYDKVSNRISKETKVTGELSALAGADSEEVQVKDGLTTYTYNALNQLVTERSPAGSITYTYDANGNLVKQSGSRDVAYSYDKENHLLRATIQKGSSVTIESYTYDYAGNRLSKTVNEASTTYYVTDTNENLAQVTAEIDRDGNEKAFYTRGDELLSVERKDGIRYYIYDGHGSTRLLTDASGRVTDCWNYDAFGSLLQREGDTENEFLYTGEQYNANTGLYYLRARYMDPSTGTFISMDSFQGSMHDPVSLHKYLYANANPVMYTDPSGYFSLAEYSAAAGIQSTLNSIQHLNSLRNIIKWANAVCTVYDTAAEIRETVLGGGTVEDLMGAVLKGVAVGFMCEGMCRTSLGIVLKPVIAVFGLENQVDQIQEAAERGDPAETAVRLVQLSCMITGITSQCFTGDTPVLTEEGLRPIDEIQAGDYVWSENVEIGESELKEVLSVSVTETDTLVHVRTDSDTVISTTGNHPFYVESRGWCAAAELETGDILRTEDGDQETVESVQTEKLSEAVKVYNLEIEDSHTYYVSAGGVLVHNACENHHIASDKSEKSGFTAKYQELFDLGGVSLQDPDNIVPLEGHKGAHTKVYKQKVFDYLTEALSGIDKEDKKKNEEVLRKALGELKDMLLKNPRLPYKGGWKD